MRCMQLKHCSKQVLDLLILLNRTLCEQPARHLLHLVASLEPSAHTEQVCHRALRVLFIAFNT